MADGEALGAVLAGGRGSRLGGAKATVELDGRPLISYPLAALADVGLETLVVAKPSTELPPELGVRPSSDIERQRTNTVFPDGVEVVLEPEEPSHPLLGIVTALRYSGRPLVVVGCDFPFAPPALLRALAEAPEPLVVPAPESGSQPLMARWAPELLPDLEAALAREESLRRTVAAIGPRLIEGAELARLGDPGRAFLNVNDPEDLRAAARAKD